jgi:hypothetical protein
MALLGRILVLSTVLSVALQGQQSLAVVIPDLGFDVPVQRIDGFQSSGLNHEFGATVSYNIGFTQAAGYAVGVDIHLTGVDPGPAVKQLWESDTERIWSTANRFDKPVLLDVRFVEQNPHQVVQVRAGPGRGDVQNWYVGWPTGTGSPAPWAHEVGHYLGNYDEYVGGGVNPNGSFMNVPDSIMGTGSTVYDRHYSFVADWAAGFASAPEPRPLLIMSVPLLLLALIALARDRRIPKGSPNPTSAPSRQV